MSGREDVVAVFAVEKWNSQGRHDPALLGNGGGRANGEETERSRRSEDTAPPRY